MTPSELVELDARVKSAVQAQAAARELRAAIVELTQAQPYSISVYADGSGFLYSVKGKVTNPQSIRLNNAPETLGPRLWNAILDTLQAVANEEQQRFKSL